MSQTWLKMTASNLGRGIENGSISPTALVKTYLVAISNHPMSERIYTYVTKERAMQEAHSAEARAISGQRLSLLDGVPISWKDLFDSKNIEENVKFPLDILTNFPEDEKIDRVNFCLERVGLVNINKKMPSEISGGMKKRVGIARAIVNKPNYLFCDEPNSGLDPQTGIKIDNLIKEITSEYLITTIIVTHDMNSVIEMGDHIMFLLEGKKLWEGTNDEITKSDVKELNDFVFATKLMKEMYLR